MVFVIKPSEFISLCHSSAQFHSFIICLVWFCCCMLGFLFVRWIWLLICLRRDSFCFSRFVLVWVSHEATPIYSIDIHPFGTKFATGGAGSESVGRLVRADFEVLSKLCNVKLFADRLR